ncbi:MAG: phosphoglycerate kinase [Candidatus Paceibacterota bacterium]
MFQKITDLKKELLHNKTVLMRVDFNVPLIEGQVQDVFRIQQVLPTIEYLVKAGAKVVLISHLGDKEATLKPVADWLNQFVPVKFSPQVVDKEAVKNLTSGQVLLLENLRQHPGEESNDPVLATELAQGADLYINEAFSVSHRAHASVVGVAKLLPSYAGFLFSREYEELSRVFKADKPLVVVLGGAKFSTKMPVVEKLAPLADHIFLGGALVHVLWRKMGYEIGQSLVDSSIKGLDEILKLKNVHLPQDVVVKKTNGERENKLPEQVGMQEVIVDAGTQTVDSIVEAIAAAKFVLWNGPLGFTEQGFTDSSARIAKAISESEAYSIVGGGDTVAVLNDLNLLAGFDFVSTAGGASLEFIASGTLVGIEALKNK